MKKVTIIVALLGLLTLGIADDVSIDSEIAAIQSAPAQERVQLMNQFKQKLSLMNQADRNKAINRLQVKTQTRTQTQTQTRERIQEMQMSNDRSMTQMNNTNQQQAAKQFMKGR